MLSRWREEGRRGVLEGRARRIEARFARLALATRSMGRSLGEATRNDFDELKGERMPDAALPLAVTETLAMLSSPVLLITTHAEGDNDFLDAMPPLQRRGG